MSVHSDSEIDAVIEEPIRAEHLMSLMARLPSDRLCWRERFQKIYGQPRSPKF
jgi:hypothetical protein